MSTHKALVLLEPRGTYVVQDVPTPVPGPGQLLVEVKAAALNPVDWKVRDYGAVPVKYPIILGSDAAGIVKEVGEGVTEFKAGDRVCVHHSVLTERSTGLTITALQASPRVLHWNYWNFSTILHRPRGDHCQGTCKGTSLLLPTMNVCA